MLIDSHQMWESMSPEEHRRLNQEIIAELQQRESIVQTFGTTNDVPQEVIDKLQQLPNVG